MAPDNSENGAKHVIKWRPIGQNLVPNVFSTSLIADHFYLSFLS